MPLTRRRRYVTLLLKHIIRRLMLLITAFLRSVVPLIKRLMVRSVGLRSRALCIIFIGLTCLLILLLRSMMFLRSMTARVDPLRRPMVSHRRSRRVTFCCLLTVVHVLFLRFEVIWSGILFYWSLLRMICRVRLLHLHSTSARCLIIKSCRLRFRMLQIRSLLRHVIIPILRRSVRFYILVGNRSILLRMKALMLFALIRRRWVVYLRGMVWLRISSLRIIILALLLSVR